MGPLGRWLALLVLAGTLATLAPLSTRAVEPDEILADPALEARARHLSAQLRCLVCQNQSIDDSSAPLAKDLRLLVRERLTAGDSDGQALDFIVARYGEFVLLRPRLEPATLLLWLAPVLLLAAAGGYAWRQARRASRHGGIRPLDAEEEARLATLLEDGDRPGRGEP